MGADPVERRPQDLAGTTFQLLALAAFIASAFVIVRPFLVAAAWAGMIVVATWPLLLRIEGWCGGRRGPAVVVMTLVLLVIVAVPFYLGVASIVASRRHVAHLTETLATVVVPEPPAWVAGVPVVGPKMAARWHAVAVARPEDLAAHVTPYAHDALRWFVGKVGSLGLLFLQLLLTIGIAALVYGNGERCARGIRRFARRLAGPRGEDAAGLAGRAVRAVALGVIVTALVQTGLTAVGLVVARVPFAAVLGAVVFVLSVAQIGPLPILVPAAIWVWTREGAGWGVGFAVWALLCLSIDNVLRPVLIRRGADLPLFLVFTGVVGGLIAFGAIGIFVGPVVLGVGYALLVEWLADDGSMVASA